MQQQAKLSIAPGNEMWFIFTGQNNAFNEYVAINKPVVGGRTLAGVHKKLATSSLFA